jgi:molybdopterin converting factor small subunit
LVNRFLSGGATIKVKVYVPAFINHEHIDPDSDVELNDGAKMSDLYQVLKLPLPLRLSFLYCVNYEQARWNTPLNEGDVVTFMLPVTGG